MEKPVVGQPVVEQLTDSAGPMEDGMRDGMRDGIPPWTRDMGAPTGDGASRPVETKESPRPNAGMNAVGATNATNTTAKDAVQAQVPATSDGASDFDLLDGDSGSAGTGGFGISGIGGFSPAPSEKSGERGSGGGGDGPGLGVLGGSLGGSTLGFVSRSPKQNEIKKSADSSSAAQDGVATAANVTPKFGTGVGFKAASAGRVTMRADSRPKKSESGPKKSEEESEAEARAAVDEAQRKLEAEMAGAAGAATGGAVGDGELDAWWRRAQPATARPAHAAGAPGNGRAAAHHPNQPPRGSRGGDPRCAGLSADQLPGNEYYYGSRLVCTFRLVECERRSLRGLRQRPQPVFMGVEGACGLGFYQP